MPIFAFVTVFTTGFLDSPSSAVLPRSAFRTGVESLSPKPQRLSHACCGAWRQSGRHDTLPVILSVASVLAGQTTIHLKGQSRPVDSAARRQTRVSKKGVTPPRASIWSGCNDHQSVVDAERRRHIVDQSANVGSTFPATNRVLRSDWHQP